MLDQTPAVLTAACGDRFVAQVAARTTVTRGVIVLQRVQPGIAKAVVIPDAGRVGNQRVRGEENVLKARQQTRGSRYNGHLLLFFHILLDELPTLWGCECPEQTKENAAE